jgi:ribonuclease HI
MGETADAGNPTSYFEPDMVGAAALAIRLNAFLRRTTNNRMELTTAIRGLETLKRRCRVRLYTDD